MNGCMEEVHSVTTFLDVDIDEEDWRLANTSGNGNYDRCIEKPFRGNSIERAGSSQHTMSGYPEEFYSLIYTLYFISSL